MTKILVCGDIHIADRPPLGRVEGYFGHIMAKLSEVVDIAEREEVDLVLSLGDFFHAKRPNFTSHATIQALQNLLARCPCPWYAVIGNHDVSSEGLASIHKQPLGVLHGTFGFETLPEMLILDDIVIVTRHSEERSLDPEFYRLTEDERLMVGKKTIIMAAHASILGPTEDRPYPHLKVDALRSAGILDGVRMLLCGDVHEPMWADQVGPGQFSFLNPGALARTQRQKQDYARKIQVCLVETKDGELVEVRPFPIKSARPATEIFIGQDKNGGGEVTDEIASFVEALAGGLATEKAPLETLLAEIEGVPDEVKELVREYLEEAGL